MKVLFVCSGNSGRFDVVPFIKAQADSIIALGYDVDVHRIVGKGMWGYAKNIPRLCSLLRQDGYDVVHAHYSLCGFVACLADLLAGNSIGRISQDQNHKTQHPARRSVVVSLLGSDVNSNWLWRYLIKSFARRWNAVIVKSESMWRKIGIRKAFVIPNGVDLAMFRPLDKESCRSKLGWDAKTSYVLFAADPARKVKNFPMAESAFTLIEDRLAKLVTLGQIPADEMPVYLNACDVLLLTSLWEGSPNTVKEAMACNCPVVSTDVGDVRWLFGDLAGYCIVPYDPVVIAQKLDIALASCGGINGRERIEELGLDSRSIALKLVDIYCNSYNSRTAI